MSTSDYEPKPIDTTNAVPGPEMAALTESLAENAHDIWAKERKAQGWTWGPERNDAEKKHPCLIPYSELPEDEKKFDRETAMGTIGAILALGAEIEVPGAGVLNPALAPPGWVEYLEAQRTGYAAPRGARAGDFDMNDAPEIAFLRTAGTSHAAEALEFLQVKLHGAWKLADARAILRQKLHRIIAAFAIWPGIAAIVFAIGQLSLKCLPIASEFPALLARLEQIAVSIALLAVVVGIFAHFHHGWLACRQLAERLRILKFNALSWPELWCDFDAWKRKVSECVEVLHSVGTIEARRWANEEDSVRPDLPDAPNCPIPAADILALAVLYRVKRLLFQRDYFVRQSVRAEKKSWIVRWKLSLVCFGLSVLAVAAHNIVHRMGDDDHAGRLDPFEIGALCLAALLPVFGFGFRAWLAAFEAPRSRNLYRAKARALDGYISRSAADSTSVEKILHHIAHGEHFFTAEHREWCRLQLEAEWSA